MEQRTIEEITNKIDDLQKEKHKLLHHRSIVQDEYNQLRRAEIELQQEKLEIMKKRQDLKIRLDKARALIDENEIEIKRNTNAFFKEKGGY